MNGKIFSETKALEISFIPLDGGEQILCRDILEMLAIFLKSCLLSLRTEYC